MMMPTHCSYHVSKTCFLQMVQELLLAVVVVRMELIVLTSTPRTRNSTSMGLGPNNFPHVVTTTTTIMTINVQFETLTLQMGPYYNASWHVAR